MVILADYWKSQPRHFCEFCKCWTADNKPSRDFHESGKRHKENVQKKLDELRKKGLADAKKEKEMSGYLQQMEKAALSKLKEDLKQDPTLASQYGVVIKSKTAASSVNQDTKSADRTDSSSVENESADSVGEWCEATTPEGYVYYWNTVTKESRWELPTSLAVPTDTAVSSQSKNSEADAAPATKKKKTMKQTDVSNVKDDKSTESAEDDTIAVAETALLHQQDRPTQHQSVYGAWQTVQQEETEADQPVDLQLPQNTDIGEVKTVTVTSEPKIKFREKKLTSLPGAVNSSGAVSFRKSKFGANRSIRSTDCSEDS